MKPTVSIIVPVYNGEATVGRCIESILSQEYQDYELLLVDDGSKDASGAICDAYAAKDSRIQVLHKENSGVSDSRRISRSGIGSRSVRIPSSSNTRRIHISLQYP